jgi:hypothetical protein
MPEQVIPQPLGGAYPVEAPKIDTSKLDARIKELEDQNKTLMDKVKQAEAEHIRQLAGQVADAKVSKKMLTKEKRDDEILKLSKLSEETLRVLYEELSQIVVNLSETDVPKPLAPPVAAPVQLSEAQVQEQKVRELRVQLFGHEEPADEFYRKQHEIEMSKRTW